MRVLQDIGDLVLLALISPTWGWMLLIGLPFLAGMVALALREALSTEEGRRKWRDYIHSKPGKRKIALMSVSSLAVVAFSLRLIMSGSHGYCPGDAKYHSDEEFIRVALEGNIRLLTFPENVADAARKEKIITDFLAQNPDCCKVFREWDSELGDLSWITWNDQVVVRIRNEESLRAYRRGEKAIVDRGLYYATVDDCLYGSHPIVELIPGG